MSDRPNIETKQAGDRSRELVKAIAAALLEAAKNKGNG